MVVDEDEVDLCDVDPGFEVTATIEASLETLTRVWVGEVTWEQAVRSGSLRSIAPEHVRRQVPGWLELSAFANVPSARCHVRLSRTSRPTLHATSPTPARAARPW